MILLLRVGGTIKSRDDRLVVDSSPVSVQELSVRFCSLSLTKRSLGREEPIWLIAHPPRQEQLIDIRDRAAAVVIDSEEDCRVVGEGVETQSGGV